MKAIPSGMYDTLWACGEQCQSRGIPEHELHVLFAKEVAALRPARGERLQPHPSFAAHSLEMPKSFVATLPGGRYWVAEDKTFAIMASDGKLIGDVSTQFCAPDTVHAVLGQESLPPPVHMGEHVAVLSFIWDMNYYHWLADVLARWYLIRQSGIPVDCYVINGRGGKRAAFQEETLAMLDIPRKQVVKSKKGIHLSAKRLIVPSLQPYALNPFVPHPMPGWAVRGLRAEMLRRTQPRREHDAPSKLYVSRGDAKIRQVVNEEQVTELLRGMGFTVVMPGQMSVKEQIRLFAGAELIVAPHGAALANLLFCGEGTGVLELFAPNYVNPIYWYMSSQLALDYSYLIGCGARAPIRSGVGDVAYRTESITVDLEALTERLRLFSQ